MSDKPRILALFAHLDLRRSRINRAMLEAIGDLKQVEVHNLLELYPAFLSMWWRSAVPRWRRTSWSSSTPSTGTAPPPSSSIGRRWSWSAVSPTGPGGTALHGKAMLQAVSTGGPVESYQPGRGHGAPLGEYLLPFQQMARFTGMRPLPPLVFQGGHTATDAQIAAHAASYRSLLEGFRTPAPESAAANPSEEV